MFSYGFQEFIIVYVNVNFDFNLYKYHGHEKTHVKFALSYPCWWVRKKNEIIIRIRGSY
jgi:hypothetical protein